MATAESVKAKIQGLIDVSNETTGREDTDLTSAVTALAEGYGSSKDSEVLKSILDRSITEFSDHEITEIGASAFRDCKALISVDLPKMTIAGNYCFNNCVALESVNMPNLLSVAQDMFGNTAKLKAVQLDAATAIYGGAFKSGGLIVANFPNVTRLIDYDIFQYSSITDANFPELLTIYTRSFANCNKLVNVNMPKLIAVAREGFSGCTALASLVLPEVTVIELYGIRNCVNLTSLRVPKLLGTYESALEGDILLGKMDFPECFYYISKRTFYGCSKLVTVILRIANQVCELKSTDAFSDTPIASGEGFVYVPDTLVEDYKVATNWSVYADQIKPLSELPEEEEGTE